MHRLKNIILPILILIAFAARSQDTPVVFNHTETAGSGSAIGLQGAGFGTKPEVWYALVAGSEKSLSPQIQLKIATASAIQVTALLPIDTSIHPTSLIAVWVKSNSKLSKPVFINGARIVSIEFDQVIAGQELRLFGRNLAGNGRKPIIYLTNAKGKKLSAAKVLWGDEYVVKITAPQDIKKDESYRIFINNGNGGVWGDNLSEEMITGHAAGTDPFGLRAAWGTEYTFADKIINVRTDARLNRKATGNGKADDRAALQEAIDLANKQGGGVVYLPAGKYRLEIPSGSGLLMRSRVVLKGDGKNESIIQYGFGTPPPYPNPIGKGGWPDSTKDGVALLWPLGTELTGLYNLQLQNVNTSGLWRHSLKVMKPELKRPGASGEKIFAVNCKFEQAVAWGLSWGYVDRFVIADCIFNSQASITWPWLWHCNGATNFNVRNNVIKYNAGRFGFNESKNGIIENNHITRRGDKQLYKGESGGFNIDYANDIQVLGNIMDTDGRSMEYHNQGETILSQGDRAENSCTGVATKATATTLTDALKNWPSLKTVGLNSSDAVAIVAGKGTGQWRRIVRNNATTITVNQPWDVIPDNSSRYVVMRWSAEDWLVRNNVLEGNNRGIWFYCGSNDVAIIGNKLINSEGIYLRADQRLAQVRYNLTWNALVADNQVIDRTGERPAFVCNVAVVVESDTLHGTGALGVEVRRNYVEAHTPNVGSFVRGEGYFNELISKKPLKNDYPATLGTIFEGNKVANADIGYRLYDGAGQALVKDAVYRNVKIKFELGKNTTFISAANPANDPFAQYLTGKAPVIVKELGEKTADGISILSVLFHSRDVETSLGKVPSHIYAAIIKPQAPGKYPGLLVLHGGGGSAEVDRGMKWAKQGYVVVAVDLPGITEPKRNLNSTGAWKNFTYGTQRFAAQPDVTHSTVFDAVLSGLQGLYMLRNLPEVDSTKVGVTGISWGGYMTTMLAGLAGEKVAASFSTYGSGFYDANSTFLKDLNKMPPTERAVWLTYLDAGRRANGMSAPYFLAAATNDNWFYPPAVMATLGASNATINHFFSPNDNHAAKIAGGNATHMRVGTMDMELPYFEYYLKGKGQLLPMLIVPEPHISRQQNTVQFYAASKGILSQPTLYYSTADALWPKRKWVAVNAVPVKDKPGYFEAAIPKAAVTTGTWWYASISDDKPSTVSSLMYECQE